MVALGWMPDDQPLETIKEVLLAILQDPEREDSLPSLISSLRYNAAAARDRLSDDTWRLFNRIERDAQVHGTVLNVSASLAHLDTQVLDLSAFSGMQTENMTHGHGWRFMELGRRIERGRVISVMMKEATRMAARDEACLEPLLEICDSTMTYRRLHFARPRLVPTAYLLLQDVANPRSVAYQLDRLASHAAKLPHTPRPDEAQTEEARVKELKEILASVPLTEWTSTPEKAAEALPGVCDALATGLEDLSHAITEHFFSHAVRIVR
jgi:uncharacterized alpha-E superfamily protein